jgi:hypothetical protein
MKHGIAAMKSGKIEYINCHEYKLQRINLSYEVNVNLASQEQSKYSEPYSPRGGILGT